MEAEACLWVVGGEKLENWGIGAGQVCQEPRPIQPFSVGVQEPPNPSLHTNCRRGRVGYNTTEQQLGNSPMICGGGFSCRFYNL